MQKHGIKVVYIAGPFRASNAWEVEQNIRRAEALALEVWRLGAAAICPHANTRFFDGAAANKIWLTGDLEILRRCDAVVMVMGWHESSGATQERKLAQKLNLPIFYEGCLDELETWIKQF